MLTGFVTESIQVVLLEVLKLLLHYIILLNRLIKLCKCTMRSVDILLLQFVEYLRSALYY